MSKSSRKLIKNNDIGDVGHSDLQSLSLDLIPTGSALLNLALSDCVDGGFVKGSIVNIIGDSSSGKTFLAWSIFAEVIHDKQFVKYRLIYDEPERALQFQLANLFGKSISRVDTSIASETIQDWYKNIMEVIKDGGPFIYVLDSFDALTSVEELERKDVGKGGWKTEQAIASSEILRQIVSKVNETESLVVVISQTRDNIGIAFGEKKSRSGGKALRFYSTHEIWMAVKKPILRKKRNVGIRTKIKCKKNKFTGKLREAEFDILFDYGIDDVGSMVDWLLEETFWSGGGRSKINTNGDFEDAMRDNLIGSIESNNKEQKLRKIVGQCWNEIEEEISTNRKPKYISNSGNDI